jgi:hypothetical protein
LVLRLVATFLATVFWLFSPLAQAISASVGRRQSSEHMVIGQLPMAQLLMHHSVDTW